MLRSLADRLLSLALPYLHLRLYLQLRLLFSLATLQSHILLSTIFYLELVIEHIQVVNGTTALHLLVLHWVCSGYG